MEILKIVTVLTGSVITGEALALLMGMFLLSPQPNSWITSRNTFWLALDILCGAGLISLMLLWRGNFRDVLLFALALIAFSSHVYREWEYFTNKSTDRFLINIPLFVLNTVKLIGIIAIAGIMLITY